MFDKLAGPLVLPRMAEWTPEQCLAIALVSTQVPSPAARVMMAEVPGWPSPQVIVGAAQPTGDLRAIALRLEDDVQRVAVCEARLTETVGALAVDTVFGMGRPCGSVATGCHVNGFAVDCTSVISPNADHVLLRLALPPDVRGQLNEHYGWPPYSNRPREGLPENAPTLLAALTEALVNGLVLEVKPVTYAPQPLHAATHPAEECRDKTASLASTVAMQRSAAGIGHPTTAVQHEPGAPMRAPHVLSLHQLLPQDDEFDSVPSDYSESSPVPEYTAAMNSLSVQSAATASQSPGSAQTGGELGRQSRRDAPGTLGGGYRRLVRGLHLPITIRLPQGQGRYTVIGTLEGAINRPKDPAWNDDQCLHDAVSAATRVGAHLHGGVLRFPLPGLFRPQVLLSRVDPASNYGCP